MKRLANTKQRLAETLTAINEAIQFKQHYPDITFTLYLIAKEYLHNDPVLTPQLNALKGIFQPLPSEYVESLFDSCTEQFEESLVKQLGYRLPEWIVEQLLAFLPNRPMSIIDLGGGTGDKRIVYCQYRALQTQTSYRTNLHSAEKRKRYLTNPAVCACSYKKAAADRSDASKILRCVHWYCCITTSSLCCCITRIAIKYLIRSSVVF